MDIQRFIYDFVVAGETPESKKPSVVDEEEEEEEGLPSPPLDEGAFFTTQPTSLELSQVHIIDYYMVGPHWNLSFI